MKRLGIVAGLITFGTFVILSMAPRAAGATAPAGDPVKGQKVFADQKCATCHMVAGVGAKLAPDLSAVGTKRDAAWLAKYLPNPTTIDPKNPPKIKMKATTAKGQDLDDLIAYLLSLKGKK